MNYWILSLILGVCAIIVILYLLKRVQRKNSPRTDENEIIIGDSPEGPVVKKGKVDDED